MLRITRNLSLPMFRASVTKGHRAMAHRFFHKTSCGNRYIHHDRALTLPKLKRHWRPTFQASMTVFCAMTLTMLMPTTREAKNDAFAPHRFFDDDYDIDYSRALGSGAFGMVVQCIKKLDKSRSAVKVISDCYEEATREKNALSCVKSAGGHSNIIALKDHYNHDGFHYLVIEYVNGTTLFDYVAQHKQLDETVRKGLLMSHFFKYFLCILI
jgi:hypothetical protein